MKKLLSVILLLICFSQSKSQQGCTDPPANNYNAAAIDNNGSCTYNTTNYSPLVKVDPLSDSVIETSGLQMAGGYLWTFNDRLGKPSLYRIDTTSNAIQQRVILKDAANIDWEDIAFDGTYFYIGDFGNNQNGGRTDLKIYKFPFNTIDLNNPVDTIQPTEIETINFIFSDQPQPVVASGYNNTKYDCEAMIVDNNKIHLFGKNWVDNTTTHYVINSTNAGNYTAMAMETFANGYLVTAADKVQGQNIIVLLGYQNSGFGNHYMHILSDYKADSFFTGNKRKIDLGDATVMGQAEGIVFRNGKYGYISNEKFVRMVGPVTLTVNQKLKSFDISNFVGNYFTKYLFTGNGNWSDSNNWKDNIQPPASLVAGNEIIIDPISGGVCTLDIQYTMPAGTKLTVSSDKNFVMNGNLNVQ
ncbi:MAG: T9SS C-terminal target domain-containing protein [Bacteroidota bacterium]